MNADSRSTHGRGTLTREREMALARRWRNDGDTAARDELARAHLRSVVQVANRYRRHGAAHDELISEGNLGLVRALAKFDPERGTRFVTYAVYWIRAYMVAHLARSRSLVSSGVHSKLLSKIRHARVKAEGLFGIGEDTDVEVSRQLNISTQRLHALVERLEVHDLSLNADSGDGSPFTLLDLVGDPIPSNEQRVVSAEIGKEVRDAVSSVLATLDARERYVVEQRLMADPEESLSLAEIGRRLGFSRERARQLESRAKRKIATGLKKACPNGEWFEWREAA